MSTPRLPIFRKDRHFYTALITTEIDYMLEDNPKKRTSRSPNSNQRQGTQT